MLNFFDNDGMDKRLMKFSDRDPVSPGNPEPLIQRSPDVRRNRLADTAFIIDDDFPAMDIVNYR